MIGLLLFNTMFSRSDWSDKSDNAENLLENCQLLNNPLCPTRENTSRTDRTGMADNVLWSDLSDFEGAGSDNQSLVNIGGEQPFIPLCPTSPTCPTAFNSTRRALTW